MDIKQKTIRNDCGSGLIRKIKKLFAANVQRLRNGEYIAQASIDNTSFYTAQLAVFDIA